MIEYALLCQTIADWRAGRRPSLPQSAAPTLVAAGAGTGTAPISVSSFEGQYGDRDVDVGDGDGEEIEAGDAELEDDAAYPVADELETEVPVEDEYGAAPSAPPDYDSTMVYGAGGAMPGQWPQESQLGGDTPRTGLADDGEPGPQRS